MSDQALVWKATFGSLVLVFCAASYVMRHAHDAPPVASDPTATHPPAPLLIAPLVAPISDAAAEGAGHESPPVRVSVALHDATPAADPSAMTSARMPRATSPAIVTRAHMRAKPRAPAQKVQVAKPTTQRLHTVSFRRKPSPYAIGRTHYPYDPRKDRWAMRDAP
jgi:hypothetical protein